MNLRPFLEYSDRRAYRLAITSGLIVAAIDSRLADPGFPAGWVILFSILLGIGAPARPWRWPAVMIALLLAGKVLRMTPAPHWFWTNAHQTPWLGHVYDRLGVPTQNPPTFGDWIAIFPGLAAAYLGQWLAHTFPALREREKENAHV